METKVAEIEHFEDFQEELNIHADVRSEEEFDKLAWGFTYFV
jgi:hypothetical protein